MAAYYQLLVIGIDGNYGNDINPPSVAPLIQI